MLLSGTWLLDTVLRTAGSCSTPPNLRKLVDFCLAGITLNGRLISTAWYILSWQSCLDTLRTCLTIQTRNELGMMVMFAYRANLVCSLQRTSSTQTRAVRRRLPGNLVPPRSQCIGWRASHISRNFVLDSTICTLFRLFDVTRTKSFVINVHNATALLSALRGASCYWYNWIQITLCLLRYSVLRFMVLILGLPLHVFETCTFHPSMGFSRTKT